MSSKRDAPMRTSLSRENLMLRGIPVDYLDCSLDDYVSDDEVKRLFEKYIKYMHDMYDDRECLILYGSNGTGKTYLSSILVKEAYRRRYLSALVTLSEYMHLTFDNRDDYMVERLKAIQEADFLVIDEVGKENFTKTKSNIALFEDLLRGAVTKGQAVIICTNLPLEDADGFKGLYSQYGSSIRSLIDGGFLKIEFEDDDYRPKVFKAKRATRLLTGRD